MAFNVAIWYTKFASRLAGKEKYVPFFFVCVVFVYMKSVIYWLIIYYATFFIFFTVMFACSIASQRLKQKMFTGAWKWLLVYSKTSRWDTSTDQSSPWLMCDVCDYNSQLSQLCLKGCPPCQTFKNLDFCQRPRNNSTSCSIISPAAHRPQSD